MIPATWASCGFIVFVVLLAHLELELPPRNLLLGLGLEQNQPCSFIIFVPIWMQLCIIIEALYPSDRPSLSRKIKVRKGLFCFNLWSAALHKTASTAYVPLLSTVCWKIWQNQFWTLWQKKKGGGEATPLKPGIGIRLRKRLWTKLFIMSILITWHTRSHSFLMSVYRTCSKWVSRQHSTKK